MSEQTWRRAAGGLAGLLLLATVSAASAARAVAAAGATAAAETQLRFSDDFEGDLSGWKLIRPEHILIQDSGSEKHGRVLVLEAGGPVSALVSGSDTWGPIRFELDVLFPDDADNYLGIIYNYAETTSGSSTRADFGSLYIKGNGSYIRANPWRDGNVSRLLYEEYKTPLRGDDAITINQWHRVKAEIMGHECHLYVGDMATPKLTFALYEGDSGLVGVNPRVTGWPVWIDNVEVSSIERLSYDGPDIPIIDYEPEALLTDWEVSGPFPQPMPAIERPAEAGPVAHTWRPFATDPRGAVVTGRVTEYAGSRPVAYFRTTITSETEREVVLHLTTTDEFAMWVNGEFFGFNYRNGYVFGERDWNAWWDFHKNAEHVARREPIELRPGKNEILLRVRNGPFASGGFFAALEESE